MDDTQADEGDLLAEHELEAFLQTDKCYTCGFQAQLGSVFRCDCGKSFHPSCEYTEAQLSSVLGRAQKCQKCRSKDRVPPKSASIIDRAARSRMSSPIPLYPFACPCGVFAKGDSRIQCTQCKKMWHLSCAKESLATCNNQFICSICVNREHGALRAGRERLTQRGGSTETRPPPAPILKAARAKPQRAARRDRNLLPSPSRAVHQPRCARCEQPAQGTDGLGKCLHCHRLFHARCGEVALSAALSQIGCDECR